MSLKVHKDRTREKEFFSLCDSAAEQSWKKIEIFVFEKLRRGHWQ